MEREKPSANPQMNISVPLNVGSHALLESSLFFFLFIIGSSRAVCCVPEALASPLFNKVLYRSIENRLFNRRVRARVCAFSFFSQIILFLLFLCSPSLFLLGFETLLCHSIAQVRSQSLFFCSLSLFRFFHIYFSLSVKKEKRVKQTKLTYTQTHTHHHHSSSSRMPHQPQSTGQITCQGCHVTLAYPIGAPSVRCPMCTTVTPVQQFSVTCVCCRCILILPQNTSLAMCPRCRTVMSIPASIREGHSGPQAPPKQCVYIDRPATVDASGAKVSHLAVGTKLDDDQPRDKKK